MKKLIVISAFLIVFGCQTNDQVKPQSVEGSNASTSNISSNKKENTSNSRVGGHPYWYFYRSQSTTHLRSAFSDDGLTWGGDQMFTNNIGSTTSPAAVIFNNKFYCIYKGGGSNNIYFSSSTDGVNWQPNTQIPNVTTAHAPTAVVANGYLYVFYVRVTSGTIYYFSTPDGINWSTAQSIHPYPDTCEGGLTAVVLGSGIRLYYSSNGGELRHRSTYNPLTGGTADFGSYNWHYNESEQIIKTTVGVSVVVAPDAEGFTRIWIAYKSPTGGRLNIFRSNTYPFGNVYWTGAYTSNNPSMVYFDNKFTIVYKSLSSNAILRGTSTDGVNWSSNHGAIGQTTNGGPRMVVE